MRIFFYALGCLFGLIVGWMNDAGVSWPVGIVFCIAFGLLVGWLNSLCEQK